MDDLGRRVLEFEGRRYVSPAAKELAIRDELGIDATRYFQVLLGLLEDPAAEIAEPVLIHRLRRRLAGLRLQRDARPRDMRGEQL